MLEIFIAKDSASVVIDGERYILLKGVTRVREGHDLVRTYPELFQPIDVHYDVEQATKGPGERRGVRPRKDAQG